MKHNWAKIEKQQLTDEYYEQEYNQQTQDISFN